MIELKNVYFQYTKNNNVLNDVSLSIKDNSFTAILGKNGEGKTTLFKLILRLNKANQGNIFINDKNIIDFNQNELAKIIAYVPQNVDLGDMSVYEAILIGRKPYVFFNYSQKDYDIADEIINKLHLEDIILKNVNTLSGGQKQLVAIGRALAQKSKYLILDEPISNLDINHQYMIFELLQNLQKERNLTIIVSIHDLNFALNYSDNFILFKNNKVYKQGKITELKEDDINNVFDVNCSFKLEDKFKYILYKKEIKNEK